MLCDLFWVGINYVRFLIMHLANSVQVKIVIGIVFVIFNVTIHFRPLSLFNDSLITFTTKVNVTTKQKQNYM